MSRLLLSGKWQMRQRHTKPRIKGWLPATVPGCVHTDLLAAETIPDPNVGTNELDILWTYDSDWEYERSFAATAAQASSAVQQLVFDGIDTIGDVYLNDKLVGRSENMFRRYRFDVRGVLVEGENHLRVVLHQPIKYACDYADSFGGLPTREHSGDWGLHPPIRTCRAAIRKGQYQFGWDWGIFAPTSGIWQQCYLLTTSGGWIDSAKVVQRHRRAAVDLEITADVHSAGRTSGRLLATIDGQKPVVVAAKLKRGSNSVAATVTIRNPRLWWPAGQGDQPLYDLKLEWLSDTGGSATGEAEAADVYQTRIGLRTVELVQEKEAVGRTFKFRINGRDIYCKGANWIPDDVFPTRTSPERYEFLLQSAVDANMNMIRVWGGGVYADELFLDLCDEKGIMVWHDFMFACASYPTTRDFLKNVQAEMRCQIRRMFNRACIVLWCGNNENQSMAHHWVKGQPQQQRMIKAYEKLTYDTMEPLVLEEDSTRPWWPSSPSGSRGEMPSHHGDPILGDMHYWGVWHSRKPFNEFLALRPRFCSEFGFQSFPSLETLQTVVPADQMNVSAPTMEHHQRNRAGNSIITDFLTRHFRFPKDFDGFCYLSQVNHGLAMQTAIEHWRRIKPWCMGTLYWQFNDDWQVASWAGIDWCLRWKALHYMARRFYAPLLGSILDETRIPAPASAGGAGGEKRPAGLQLWATSDVPRALKGKWEVAAHHAVSGKLLWRKAGVLSLKANESKMVANLPRKAILDKVGGEAQNVVLLSRVESGEMRSDNVLHLVDLKRTELPQARLESTVSDNGDGTFTVEVATDAPAYYVELSTGKYRGVFSDNYFCLLPGRKTKLEFRPIDSVTLRQLRGALKVRSVCDTY